MESNYQLKALGELGVEQWSNAAIQKLGFSKADMKIPKNEDIDTFNGEIQIEEFNNKTILVKVDSSPQQISLIHQDSLELQKKHIILLHAYSGLIVTSPHQRIYVPRGDSVLVPAWEPYIETCLTHRNSLSFIIDINTICDNENNINPLYWKNLSEQGYGDIFNSLLLQFYKKINDRCSEKLINTIVNVLSLQLDKSLTIINKNKNFICDVPSMLDFIRSNMKKNDFSLNSMASEYNVTPRAIQYKLKKHNIKFHNYLNKLRSELFLNKIIRDPKASIEILALECGFKTVNIANRYFKCHYNMTPVQYRRKLLLR